MDIQQDTTKHIEKGVEQTELEDEPVLLAQDNQVDMTKFFKTISNIITTIFTKRATVECSTKRNIVPLYITSLAN